MTFSGARIFEKSIWYPGLSGSAENMSLDKIIQLRFLVRSQFAELHPTAPANLRAFIEGAVRDNTNGNFVEREIFIVLESELQKLITPLQCPLVTEGQTVAADVDDPAGKEVAGGEHDNNAASDEIPLEFSSFFAHSSLAVGAAGKRAKYPPPKETEG